MTLDLRPIRWFEAEPSRLEREREEMAACAPNLRWIEWSADLSAGGFEGDAPAWPFDREQPEPGLTRLLDGRRLSVRVQYLESFPAVEPKVWPLLDPPPDPLYRTQAAWHVNGDGSLCLLQTADMWTGRETAAGLVVKASGWFIEYLLMEANAVERMTLSGINSDTSLDEMIRRFGADE
jgi:hypothetical protein